MATFLLYELKVAALIAVFYVVWRLLFARETLHRANRAVLLSVVVASFVLPLCVVTIHREVPLTVILAAEQVPPAATEAPVAPQESDFEKTVFALFLFGAAVTLGRSLLSVARITLLIKRSEKHPAADGITIAVTEKDVQPFSWMHFIVMNRTDWTQPDGAILAHERGHIRSHHSLDVVLVDFLTALQWFNPAIWMLRADLRALHEFEADLAVLSQGFNARQYQYLLIRKAVGYGGYSVANSFNHSTLQNRITMMLRNKSSQKQAWKGLALLPIVGIALAMNAETVTDFTLNGVSKNAENTQKTAVSSGKLSSAEQTIAESLAASGAENKRESGEDTLHGKAKTSDDNRTVLSQEEQESLANLLTEGVKHVIIDGKETDKEGVKTFIQNNDGRFSCRVLAKTEDMLIIDTRSNDVENVKSDAEKLVSKTKVIVAKKASNQVSEAEKQLSADGEQNSKTLMVEVKNNDIGEIFINGKKLEKSKYGEIDEYITPDDISDIKINRTPDGKTEIHVTAKSTTLKSQE